MLFVSAGGRIVQLLPQAASGGGDVATVVINPDNENQETGM